MVVRLVSLRICLHVEDSQSERSVMAVATIVATRKAAKGNTQPYRHNDNL